MNAGVLLAIDAGTTSVRVVAYDERLRIVDQASRPLGKRHPHPDWVEQDPMEAWHGVRDCLAEVAGRLDDAARIRAIGITNQRETTIVWDRQTGRPIYNAIVWQCRRTTAACAALQADACDVRKRTGLPIDPYFSATKIAWILDHCDGARQAAEDGKLAFGTVDSWLIWHLTGGKTHATDASNASRTLLYNLHTGTWDPALLQRFNVPASMLPEIRDSNADFGRVADDLPAAGSALCGVLGDQQAALFGQCGWQPGILKNTYGTGLFLVASTGSELPDPGRLVNTVGWQLDGRRTYALEGSIFIGGALIQWLRDDLGILASAAESATLASSVPDSGGVVFVPALSGLGAPWWDPNARGTIIGITQSTTRAHLVRAALDSLAWQTRDVVAEMQTVWPTRHEQILRVDGGACQNDFLMQFQADVLGMPVERPVDLESTARGAAAMAGLGIGCWQLSDLAALHALEHRFLPDNVDRSGDYARWQRAVDRSRGWATESS